MGMEDEQTKPTPAAEPPVTRPPSSSPGSQGRTTSKSAALWAFLNTNFGIFVCSSIVLASFSLGYNRLIKHEEDQRRIEQLDVEIRLRLRDMETLATLADRERYNNVLNIQRVTQGDTEKFWIRRPVFGEFRNKNTTSLQLYLLAPSQDKLEIRQAVQKSIEVDRLLTEIRRKKASEPEPATAKTKEEQDKLDEEENQLKKDYGQEELFGLVTQLAQTPRWEKMNLAQ
jgi:hypothetical protein